MITNSTIQKAISDAQTECHAKWVVRLAEWETLRASARKAKDPEPSNPEPKLLPIKRCREQGMYLEVHASGSALWRLKYSFGRNAKGKPREKLISLGAYPDVSLKLAREKRDEARRLLASGVDPSAMRKEAKIAQAFSVELIAKEWLDKQEKVLDPGTIRRHRQRLKNFIYPFIGKRPISEVTPRELLAPLRRIESQGKLDTARRVRQLCGEIWRYAIGDDRAERDISADLKGQLASPVAKHHAAVTDPAEVGQLLRAIEGYKGTTGHNAKYALRLAPLLFVRPGELRRMEWAELDLDGPKPEWRIPAPKMKMRDAHIVPLSTQAVAILHQLKPPPDPETGADSDPGKYVFPSIRSGGRPMSENTVNAALRGCGYTKDQQTGHGFRTIGSTLLNELGFHPDLIELQLAHAERNKVRAAYNRAQRLDERRKMMQQWADYLDQLRDPKSNVVAIRSGSAA